MSLNLLDWVIVLAVLIAVGNGYRRGLVLSLAQYAGMLGGVLVGAALARPLHRKGFLARRQASARLAGGTGCRSGWW